MTIELRNVSRWYGNVVAVNDITMSIGPGVTGLLGPNGAGKSTIMHMIAGFLPPSRGELTIGSGPAGSGPAGSTSAWRHPAVYRQVGLVPERDSVYAFLTGSQFVTSTAKLHELPDPGAAAARAIAMLDMAEAADRKIATYSKGMRQRIKVAAALVHDPEILLLGAEIDDGSIVHLLATPVRRSSVIVTKFVIATGLTMVFAAIPELIAALIAGEGSAPAPVGSGQVAVGPGLAGLVTVNSGKLALGLFVGALACSVIYNAVFVMVSVATTRAIAVGLLYVLVWETLLSNFVSGVKLLSVSHYGLGIANGFANDTALQAGLTVTTSVVMGIIVTGLALALAVNLLSSFTLKGEPA
jgi:ABC-type Na+ transport system ATPase subunit NatA